MMNRSICLLLGVFMLLASCAKKQNDATAAFGVYCEMVDSQAKPIALHYPMVPTKIDALWPQFQQIATQYQVKLYREDDFPHSLLFPAELTKGQSVVLIYQGKRLVQYQQLAKALKADDGTNLSKSIALARRFGRLLGYSPQGINTLLAKNCAYRNVASLGVHQQTTHLYYENLPRAIHFYGEVLGLQKRDSNIFEISKEAIIALHPQDTLHPKNQPKSTAIALLTDQLPQWYAYIQEQQVPIKYTYKPKTGGPHDGFVALDPEGYLLEFEQFKQHPENELLIASIANAPRVHTAVDSLAFYGAITWTYHKDLLKVQNFYQEVLGYPLVADQGWTKIFQTSATGFIGLVDERRGMEDYAETKAVEITWQADNLTLLTPYTEQYWQEYAYANHSFKGPEGYIYHIVD